MEFLLTRSRCRPKTAWQVAIGIAVTLAACAHAPLHYHLEVLLSLKDSYYMFLYINLSNGKGPTPSIGMGRENLSQHF